MRPTYLGGSKMSCVLARSSRALQGALGPADRGAPPRAPSERGLVVVPRLVAAEPRQGRAAGRHGEAPRPRQVRRPPLPGPTEGPIRQHAHHIADRGPRGGRGPHRPVVPPVTNVSLGAALGIAAEADDVARADAGQSALLPRLFARGPASLSPVLTSPPPLTRTHPPCARRTHCSPLSHSQPPALGQPSDATSDCPCPRPRRRRHSPHLRRRTTPGRHPS